MLYIILYIIYKRYIFEIRYYTKTKNLWKNLIKKLDPLKKLALSDKNARKLDKGYLCETVNNCVG